MRDREQETAMFMCWFMPHRPALIGTLLIHIKTRIQALHMADMDLLLVPLSIAWSPITRELNQKHSVAGVF